MITSVFEEGVKENKNPILVLDKVGVIGEALIYEFSKSYRVVFVSFRVLSNNNEKIIFIPLKKRIPKIPNLKYSKIIIIDDGKETTRESISPYIKKAKTIKSEVFLIGSIRNINMEHAQEIIDSYSKARVLIFGDLFDKDVFFDNDSSITRFIKGAFRGQIKIAGEGLGLNYPMSFSDTIKLIIKATQMDISGKIISLFYPYGLTDISLAHIFQKINPNIKVDFVTDKKSQKLHIPPNSQPAIKKYNLIEKIEELGIAEAETKKAEVPDIEKSKKRSYFIKPIFFFFTACLFLFFLPFLTSAGYTFLGFRQIENAKSLVEEGKFEEALKKSENAETFFSFADKTNNIVLSQAKLLGLENQAERLGEKIDTGKDISIAGKELLEGAILIKDVYLGNSKSPKKDFSEAINSLKTANSIIQRGKARGKIPEEFDKKISNILPVINLFSNTSEVLPKVLGFEDERSYLLLFQDNSELRPGGGVIDSVGVLTLKNGRVKNFEIKSTNLFENKLETNIEPPFEVRKYLGKTMLGLRDSGFNPDFIKSADTASLIYSLKTGKKVDGVIGLDLVFLRELAGALGPVEEKRFKNTSASDLIKSIEANSDKNKMPYLSLMEIVGNSIAEKHLLFAFNDSDVQSIFTANSWSSSLEDNRKREDEIIDFFGLSESNVGKNKINFYISRIIAKKLIIGEDGKLSSAVTIIYKNDSQKNNTNAGDYKNYMRLILPEGSNMQEMSVGGRVVDTPPAITDYLIYERNGLISPEGIEINKENESGKSIYGFLISVPAESVRSVKITYSLPYTLPKDISSFPYSLLVYKQPGIESYPFRLTFQHPNDFQVFPRNSFSQEIVKDIILNFTFFQK